MTLYETLFLVHPEKGLRMKEFIERFKKVVEGQEGTVTQVEKQGRGYYTLLRYQATGRAVDELERNLKLTDGILRYLTVRYDEEAALASPASPRGHSDEGRPAPEREAPKVEPSAN